MTTAHDIDWPAVVADRLTTTHPDVLRELLSTFIHTLLGADADALSDAYAAEHLPVRVAASRGYVDEVVAPSETRERIAFALEAAR